MRRNEKGSSVLFPWIKSQFNWILLCFLAKVLLSLWLLHINMLIWRTYKYQTINLKFLDLFYYETITNELNWFFAYELFNWIWFKPLFFFYFNHWYECLKFEKEIWTETIIMMVWIKLWLVWASPPLIHAKRTEANSRLCQNISHPFTRNEQHSKRM